MKHSPALCGIIAALALVVSCNLEPPADESPMEDDAPIGDVSAPAVESVFPSDAETDISVVPAISLTFSEPVDVLLAQDGFYLSDGVTTVTGSFSWSGETMTFTPNVELADFTIYYITIYGSSLIDADGNVNPDEFNSVFVTGRDTNPPEIITLFPPDGTIDVSRATVVSVRFTESMDKTAVEGAFSLSDGVTIVSGSGSFSGTAFVFTPDVKLVDGTEYSATVSTSAKDESGNSILADCVWRFTPGVAVGISAGHSHVLALLSGGSVRAWGDNTYGQLGDGTNMARSEAVAVNGLAGATAVSASARHSLALLSDGTIKAWGHNAYGQLGDGTSIDRDAPVNVVGIANAIAVASGFSGSRRVEGYHSVAVLSDGTVMAWGDNEYGQLGTGSNINANSPVAVVGIDNATAVACGCFHTVALLADGTVMTWGRNNIGQLGNRTVTDSNTPVSVGGVTDAVAVAAGGYHTLVLLSDGTIEAWGDGSQGQLGEGFYYTWRWLPVDVEGISTAVAIAGGGYHSAAVLSNGTVKAWGNNRYRQIGGLGADKYPIPITVENDGVMVSAGGNFTVSLHNDGTVKAWGRNNLGQLGDGGTGTTYGTVIVRGL